MTSIRLRLFFTCWLIYVLHFATNTVREIYPALTLGDRLSFDVSEYLGLHPDIFAVPGRGAFIANNPGASMVAAIPYALARPLLDRIVEARKGRAPPGEYRTIYPMARDFYRQARERGLDVKFGLAAGVMQALLMAPLAGFSAVVMFRILAALAASERQAAWLAALYAFATPVFYRAAQLNHNLMVACCGFFAFALLWRPWEPGWRPAPRHQVGAGLLAGWAVMCDYSGAVVLAALAGYSLARARARREAAWFAAAAAVPVALLFLYQWHAFGNPFLPAQRFMPPSVYSHLGYHGMDWPRLDLLWSTAFGMRYGLFASAPLLLLALIGWRSSFVPRRELRYIAGFTAAFFVFCAANQHGRLQFNTGVRYILPVVPLLFLPAAAALTQMPARWAAAAGVASALWSWCQAMYRDVEQGYGIFEAIRHVALEGIKLPWLATLEAMGYVRDGVSATPLVAAAGVAIWSLWRLTPARAALAASGAAMCAAAAMLSNVGIEQLLRGTDSGALAWGPALFRILLGLDGAALATAAWLAPKPRLRPWGPLPWKWLAALTAAALALRLYRLNSGLWFDEVLTLLDFVRPPWGVILTSFPAKNQHLLYSILAKASATVFGESAWALRLPAVLFAVASLWALFLLGRRLLGQTQALVACALLALSYHHIWFSQNARGYMGVLLFTLLATWLWLEGRWSGYAVALWLGAWLMPMMVFVAAAHVLIDLVRKRGRPGWKAVAAWAAAGTLSLQVYALALPEFLRSALGEVSLPSEWTSPGWALAESWRNLRIGLGAAGVLAGAALATAGWFAIRRRDRAAAAAMVLPAALAGAAALAWEHNLWPRVFFFSMGFAVLAAVAGAMRIPRAGPAIAGLLMAASAATVPRVFALPKQDFPGARDWVERNRQPGEAAAAAGLAGRAYNEYFATHWAAIQTRQQLEAFHRLPGRGWLVYTLAVEVRGYHPGLWEAIERDFEVARVFPGTLGGGEVVVCRERP